jgi:DNA-binding protein YbaB
MHVWQLDWEFISFDPRFSGDKRMHVVEIKRSQVEADIDRLHKTLIEAIKVKHEYLKRIEL